ncbi:L-amino-acid oxidase [Colletotrichum lupini]|uniref:L-amino-acid oxidase n=1 Tax=Colletotrichum lupini TaxID=145971 RepID=A0A9Q8SI20_9PEZI|nr:L-amino-acid oxidase [Colletotrichum lupini]UQC77350.1 L-amino-acid oxidase [Colletotrichum lupini]
MMVSIRLKNYLLLTLGHHVSSRAAPQHQLQRRASTDQHLFHQSNSNGAWFDQVAALDGSSESSKNTNISIAIVEAGIYGLAIGLMLDSVGVHNWELIKASDRVGGRFRTIFVGDISRHTIERNTTPSLLVNTQLRLMLGSARLCTSL